MGLERKGNERKITQKRYIQKMTEKFNMIECKGAKVPATKGFQVDLIEEEVKVFYRGLTGNLMFVSTASRPDVSYAVRYLSQFLDKSKESA